MKNSLILGCLALVLTSTLAHGAINSVPVLRVESSRTMKVAIINADQNNPANERMHKAFAESLGFQISQQYKMPLPVRPVVTEASDAAEGLRNGSYDLVAVIGSTVPTTLLNNDFKRFKAVPATGNSMHIVNLMVAKDDRTLCAIMDKSLETALNETFFQLAFASYRKSSVDEERTKWNVAVASLQ